MRREIQKGRNVLLTSPPDIGKSVLLQASYTATAEAGRVRAIYVAVSSPNRDMLVEIARQLHEQFGALPYAELSLGKTELVRLEEDRLILGTPEECIEQIRRFRDELGLTHLICRISTPGISRDAARASLDRFAGEVLPALQD